MTLSRGMLLYFLYIAFIAASTLLQPASVTATGGVYSSTSHGSPTTGVYRDSSQPRGGCGQCHQSHDGTTPNPFGLFGPHSNSLCYNLGCHDGASTNKIYQGPTLYDQSSHATDSNMVWPGPDVALDPNAPPARPGGDWGKCLNCHDPHGYNKDGTGLIPSLAVSREEKLCLVCHDGSPAAKDVMTEFNKTSKHPLSVSGRHSASEDGQSSAYGAVPTDNRHAECVDCHNPHLAKPDSPSAPDASSLIKGVGRVVVGAGRTLTYKGADDLTSVKEYELCYKCHSSWTNLPVGYGDKASEFDPANASYHPVEAAGKNTDIDGRTLVSPWSATSLVYCTDCHTSDNTNIRGPHGSSYAPILKRAYFTGNNSTPPSTDVCFDCHVAAQYLTKTRQSNTTYTHFREGPSTGDQNFHYMHMVRASKTSCKTCHYNIHGSTTAHLVEFNTSVVSSQMGQIVYSHSSNGGSCTLKCHGKGHMNKSYRWK